MNVKLVRVGDVETYAQQGGETVAFLATAADTNGRVSIFDSRLAPGATGPWHFHELDYELFYVIAGAVEFGIGDEVIVAHEGDLVIAAPHVPRRFQALRESRMMVINAPGGPSEGFLRDVMNLAGAPNAEDKTRFIERYRIHSGRRPIEGQTRYNFPEDEKFMAKAISLAASGIVAGEVPIGAVVVVDGQVVGEANARMARDADPIAHAEIGAVRKAVAHYRGPLPAHAVMYVSCEPCLMCCAAILHAGIGTLVIGGRRETLLKGLGRNSEIEIGIPEMVSAQTKRPLIVFRGILQAEAEALLAQFTQRLGDSHGGLL